MSIGTTIKRMRKERNFTQEQLAEYLGISAQAISGWECDKFLPDIYQLPILANVFEVSVDEILEVDIANSSASIDAIIKSAKEYVNNACWQEAVEVLRDGRRKYPASHKLMYEMSNAIVCLNSRNNINDYGEVYSLCNRILSQSTDSMLRYKTLSLLALAYSYAGDTDNMRKIVEQMPSASESKESFMVWRNLDFAGEEKNKRYLAFLISEALQAMEVLSSCCKLFSDEERMEISKQEISFIEAMFPKGDYQAYAQLGCNACERIARRCYQNGDTEQFFYWLERHCDFSVYMDSYNAEDTHTSAVLCGLSFDRRIEENGVSLSKQSIEIWNNPIYDDVKDDIRFIKIMNRLRAIK